MSPDSRIEQAEANIEKMQVALDDAHRVLEVADQAQKKAERNAEKLRTLSIGLAVGGTTLIALLMLRHRLTKKRLSRLP